MPDVSVLLPSRNRPEKLVRAIRSLQAGTRCRLEIIVGLDRDDPTTRELPQIPGVRYVIGDRPKTLGQLFNKLAALSSGAWLMGFPDDYVINQGPDWVGEILRAGEALPRRIGLLYFRDELNPTFPSIPILSRRTCDVVGYFVPDEFAFWFTDTWWGEIAEFFGRKIQLPVSAAPPGGVGQTHGMIDLKFWADFFEATRPRRAQDAVKLLQAAYGEHSLLFLGQLSQFRRAERICAQRVAFLHSPRVLAFHERRAASTPGPHYAEVKRGAEPTVEQYRAGRARFAEMKSAKPPAPPRESGRKVIAPKWTFNVNIR